MASSTFTLDVAMKSLLERGFCDLNDSAVGERVSEMKKKGFPYLTEYGLEFCQQFAFDERIRSILECSFDRCSLGHWLRYEKFPGHIECFRRGGPKAGRRVLMVHLWARGSHVKYYAGSHSHDLQTTKGLRSLHEIPPTEMARVDAEPVEKSFPDGGIVILDARLGFQIMSGYAITFLFATDEVVAKWAKIVLPYSAGLEQKVANIKALSTKIGFNFRFEFSPGITDKQPL